MIITINHLNTTDNRDESIHVQHGKIQSNHAQCPMPTCIFLPVVPLFCLQPFLLSFESIIQSIVE